MIDRHADLLDTHQPPAGPPRPHRGASSSGVAQEVREHIIDTVGEIGGHFGANLGTCELAVALHSLLDSPARQDPLGRRPPGLPAQGPDRPPRPAGDDPQVRRPRPVLLDRRVRARHHGRRARLDVDRLRASGIKEGMRRGRERATATSSPSIGDGAMTGGVAFEAIHQAGGLGTPIVVVLNDNGMSIAPNVGALSPLLQPRPPEPEAVARPRGRRGRRSTKLPAGIGAAFERLGPHFKESIKAFWAPGPVVGGARLGLHGRDRRARRPRAARRAARGARRRAAVVVHCATVKGKGFAPAEDGGLEGMESWHAAKPKSIANGAPHRRRAASPPAPAEARRPQYTQVFGEALVRECARDERVVGITAAMNSGTGLNILQKRAARALLRRRHRRAAGGPVRRRARARGRASRWRRSTRRSCSAPTTRSSTTSACRS